MKIKSVPKKGMYGWPRVAHEVVGLAVQKVVNDLEDVLEFAGPVHREAGAQQREQHHDDQRDEDFHRHVVRPGVGRIFGPHADDRQSGVCRTGQKPIQECGDPEVMFHRSVRTGSRR